jgi:hypothetical protein
MTSPTGERVNRNWLDRRPSVWLGFRYRTLSSSGIWTFGSRTGSAICCGFFAKSAVDLFGLSCVSSSLQFLFK